MEDKALEHNLFKPKSLEEGRHEVVGDCNGFSMEERWKVETPLFAKAIRKWVRWSPNQNAFILDYGCGVGRLAKEIVHLGGVNLVGIDASKDMLNQAEAYVNSDRFAARLPTELTLEKSIDLAYCVYVLQHVPSIEIREILQRIHYLMKDDGFFVYCSSDYRMAIRFDGQGFFDDRFMGIDLQYEVSRYFEKIGPLFDQKTLDDNPLLNKMISGNDGGLPHPAFVYRKRVLQGPAFNAVSERAITAPTTQEVSRGETEKGSQDEEGRKENLQVVPSVPVGCKLVLCNRLAPGDILVMTNAIRDLHLAYPGKFTTDVRTPCNELFENNPYIKPVQIEEPLYQRALDSFRQDDTMEPDKHFCDFDYGNLKVIDMHYPIINTSGKCGWHFSYGHRDWLERVLGVKIPQTDIRPEIYLSQAERDWPVNALLKAGVDGPYWVINAGSKNDFTLKQYPYWATVAETLHAKGITLVQVGDPSHNHPSLQHAVNLIGKTTLRELARVIAKAEGVLTCVSFPMHVAAAFNRPCVVVAGAREGARWEMYPSHQFLYVNGCLPCATYDGCWKSTHSDCNNKVKGIPKCMTLIEPYDVVRAVQRYYDGGMIQQTLNLDTIGGIK